ncbi:DUF5696 domain-containing protein [Fictibacillus fluitans]|uniref:DUF5696 domain-containing protein n=1 Tax=Fictibacillus fluitans TaxID=3058422 RepID=A0ABT8HUP7_9BACL|nr:DUF5696 domain-containing protein [Fictibacillus sp. NE201]MDN4524493.1 DUF5696 domain-containing protein [Fictibacillus sp. NE201]
MFRFTVKKAVFGVMLAVLLLISSGITGASGLFTKTKDVPPQEMLKKHEELSAVELSSNRYTQPDKKQKEVKSPSIPAEYKKEAETPSLALYVDSKTMGIMVENKKTGYVWSSYPSKDTLKKEQLNEDWSMLVRSPVMIDYFNDNAGLDRGSVASLDGQVMNKKAIKNGFQFTVDLKKLKTSFDVQVSIEESGLVVNVPEKSWSEKDHKLANIYVYPFLGSTRLDDVPGYMMIPDGSGALIRYQKPSVSYDEPFVGRIFGQDYSVNPPRMGGNRNINVTMPVFGAVHGEGQNGFLGIVEKGQYNAEIVAYPAGLNTNFNWISPRFIIRNAYFQPTSKNMGGYNTYQKTRIQTDLKIRYSFLQKDEASYTGMAKSYRSYLENKGILKKTKPAKTDVPAHVEFLGGEMEKGLFSRKFVEMTKFQDVDDITKTLKAEGLSNLDVLLRGWNHGGLTGSNPERFPVASELGGEDGLTDLAHVLKNRGIALSLQLDYTYGYEGANNFNEKTEAARKITNQVLIERIGSDPFEKEKIDLERYYISPHKAVNLAREDTKELKNIPSAGAALENTGSVLFSDFRKSNPVGRDEAASDYMKLADHLSNQFDDLALYQPNAYLLKHASKIYNIEMDSSQYMYATDTVPFVQMVLHGYINYFTSPLNFAADKNEMVLKMVETGAYPSFYFTKQPSHLLSKGPSKSIGASYYKDWLDDAKEIYERVKKPLGAVAGETIENRKVYQPGVVEVTYSNGTVILVNYESKAVKADGRTIPARDFLLSKRGSRQ